MDDQLFVMRNQHAPGCGEPPVFSNEVPGRYHGYFENAYGEQWVFVYDQTMKTGELRGGDAGWAQVYEVGNGQAEPRLVLQQEESEWLRACWRAATGK